MGQVALGRSPNRQAYMGPGYCLPLCGAGAADKLNPIGREIHLECNGRGSMATWTPSSSPAVPSEQDLAPPQRPPRFWLPVAILTLFWIAFFVVGALEKPYFYGFLYGMGAAGLLALVFSIWWWTNRRIKLSDRALGCILVVGLGVLIAPF